VKALALMMGPGYDHPMNIPNVITAFRIILIPIFAIVFYLPFKWAYPTCAAIFALASFTDWLDGYLARSLKQTSSFGAFFDPVADKLIVTTALVLLVAEKSLPFIAIPAAIIVGRELVVSALREWMAEIGKRQSIAVTYVTKVKTAVQMFAIVCLLLYHPENSLFVGIVGYVSLYIAAALTLYTMMVYLKIVWPTFEFARD
jgi:CDP-diacylglycerol---glycerol-3-phosphate 3-phosphatidyltransferase